MHAHNRRVDHLHGGVMGASKRVHDLAPDARSPPANEAIVGGGVWTKTVRRVPPSGAAAWPLTARAQEAGRIYRIGVLSAGLRDTPDWLAVFDELRRAGFTRKCANVSPNGAPSVQDFSTCQRPSRVMGQVTIWQTTTRESEPRCDGRCAQSCCPATVQDALCVNRWRHLLVATVPGAV